MSHIPIRRLSLLLIPLSIVVLVGVVQAQHFGHRAGGPGPEAMKEMIFEKLNLDDTQREQMTQLHDRHRQAMEVRHEEMKAAHEMLESAIDAEVFDEAAIREAADGFGRLQTEMFVARAEMQQEARRILTPEQFEQLQQVHERHRGKMMGHHPGGFGQFRCAAGSTAS